MGKTGRGIVGVDVKQLIKELNSALADEWQAAFHYWAASHVVSGLSSPAISGFLKEQAKEEMEHADSLAERIVQLGGRVVDDPSKLKAHAAIKYLIPSMESSNVKKFLQDALSIERKVISAYDSLAKKTFGKDPVTYGVITKILASEVEEEEKLENLLGER
jgi:bacterioferritin